MGWYIIAYAFYDEARDTQNAFVTDGCTLFVDGVMRTCCVAHDHAYWQGGSSGERKHADEILRACVQSTTQSNVLAYSMYVAVRIGGTPYVQTPWRWGFGWTFGRGYR